MKAVETYEVRTTDRNIIREFHTESDARAWAHAEALIGRTSYLVTNRCSILGRYTWDATRGYGLVGA